MLVCYGSMLYVFLTNIYVAEVIPFSLSEIIHDLNLLECGVILGSRLIPGLEDENIVLV